MNVFIYEFLTGGGLFALEQAENTAPAAGDSLLIEGRAMVEAVAADFAAIDGVTVHLLRDTRFELTPEADCQVRDVVGAEAERQTFLELAADADWTLVIAPEFDGLLADRCGWVDEAGGRRLGPGPKTVAVASDKTRTAKHLAASSIPVPNGRTVEAGSALPPDFEFPAVLKPRDGAGSTNTHLIANAEQADTFGLITFDGRLEPVCDGLATSVAVLCGPEKQSPLTPCAQRITDDGRFTYLGGSLPVPDDLAQRATRLALAAIATLPDPFGYIGIDLILGRSVADDVVLEINPRLTTSYVGLRAAACGNLALAMLAVAAGRSPGRLYNNEPDAATRAVEFDADGTVRITEGITP